MSSHGTSIARSALMCARTCGSLEPSVVSTATMISSRSRASRPGRACTSPKAKSTTQSPRVPMRARNSSPPGSSPNSARRASPRSRRVRSSVTALSLTLLAGLGYCIQTRGRHTGHRSPRPGRLMIVLRRIHHVCLRVADLDDAVRRWSVQFGLTERERTGERAYLACAYEPYSLELVEAPEPGADHAGFELARGVTLDDAAAHLDGLGVPHRRDEHAVHLSDPDGFGVE